MSSSATRASPGARVEGDATKQKGLEKRRPARWCADARSRATEQGEGDAEAALEAGGDGAEGRRQADGSSHGGGRGRAGGLRRTRPAEAGAARVGGGAGAGGIGMCEGERQGEAKGGGSTPRVANEEAGEEGDAPEKSRRRKETILEEYTGAFFPTLLDSYVFPFVSP